MKLTRLKLVDVRTIASAEFHFQPDFNLIAGVNGVGKTTVLDALAACFSAIIRHANHRPRYGKYFTADDIRVDGVALQLECDIKCAGDSYGYRFHKFRDYGPSAWSPGMVPPRPDSGLAGLRAVRQNPD